MTDERPFQERLQAFVSLSNEKRDLEARLKRTVASLDDLESTLLSEMGNLGMSNARMDGLTVYIHRQLWARAAQHEETTPDGNVVLVSDPIETCNALVEAGLGDFVHPAFNTNTVSAWVRELPRDLDGQPILPPELQGRITVREDFSLRTRR